MKTIRWLKLVLLIPLTCITLYLDVIAATSLAVIVTGLALGSYKPPTTFIMIVIPFAAAMSYAVFMFWRRALAAFKAAKPGQAGPL